MQFDWQNLAALILVGLAVSYLAWQGKRAWFKQGKPGCGSCENCPAPQVDTVPTLVSLENLTTPGVFPQNRDVE